MKTAFDYCSAKNMLLHHATNGIRNLTTSSLCATSTRCCCCTNMLRHFHCFRDLKDKGYEHMTSDISSTADHICLWCKMSYGKFIYNQHNLIIKGCYFVSLLFLSKASNLTGTFSGCICTEPSSCLSGHPASENLDNGVKFQDLVRLYKFTGAHRIRLPEPSEAVISPFHFSFLYI